MTEEQQRRIKAPRPEKKQSVDDFLFEQELAQIAAERARANGGNGSHEAPRFCWCRECEMSDGKRIAAPKFHSCEYVAARSALVFTAATLAGATGATGNDFTRAFSREMERLSRSLLSNS
jgi:hypothetical protein